jgi:hypothetical protein
MSPAALEEILTFAQGALTALSLVAALFFLRYWRSTGDRLFAFFSIAFVLFSASWTALATRPSVGEHDAYVYLLRLAAFAAIIIGIVDKNRRA